jgi:hypothetical protein
MDTLTQIKNLSSQNPPKDWRDRQYQKRGVSKDPSNFLWMDLGAHSDWYQKDIIKKFVDAANKYGVSPADYVALGISESGLGNQHSSNPSRINWDVHNKRLAEEYPEYAERGGLPAVQREVGIDFGAKYLSEQLKRFPDKLSGIQAYSGTGRTPYNGKRGGRYFGTQIRDLNLWKDKPQARRVMEFSDKLKSIPELIHLLAKSESPRAEQVLELWSK